ADAALALGLFDELHPDPYARAYALAEELLRLPEPALRGARRGPVSLDASLVERLGGQCLQVLLSAATTWAQEGEALSVSCPSENFLADLGLLGLTVDAFNIRDVHP
ncbi:MAG: STAS domain-containing protein, partial [Rhizobiaceae bacterium]